MIWKNVNTSLIFLFPERNWKVGTLLMEQKAAAWGFSSTSTLSIEISGNSALIFSIAGAMNCVKKIKHL